MNPNWESDSTKHVSDLIGVNIWNWPANNPNEFVQFKVETPTYQQSLRTLHTLMLEFWNTFELEQNDDCTFTLVSSSELFENVSSTVDININNFTILNIINELDYNGSQYLILANQFIYIILADDEIYDWGLITWPEFAQYRAPIFNVTYPEGHLIYGLNIHCGHSNVIKNL